MRQRRNLVLYSIIVAGVFVWSGIRPHDYFTWCLEVLPAVLALGILAATFHRFEFTGLVYFLVMLHAIVLVIGGHYTYAEVPLFNWIRDHFVLARNDYDRVGHFFQGFVPAIVTREVLLRATPLKKGKMVAFLTVCVCMAFSALYELFEWRVAVLTGSAADAFLGRQGDVWDTQEDMAMCLVGSILSLLTLSRLHNRFVDEKLAANAIRFA